MKSSKKSFGGDKKVGHSLMSGPENRLKNLAVPRIPPGIETYHLTLTTLLWSVGNVIAGFYAKENLEFTRL